MVKKAFGIISFTAKTQGTQSTAREFEHETPSSLTGPHFTSVLSIRFSNFPVDWPLDSTEVNMFGK